MWNVSEVSNWTGKAEPEHFAQFYETDEFLIDSLTEFVSAGLVAGEAVLIVATGPHRRSLRDSLVGRGFDIEQTTISGQYVALDAAETLGQFMVDGSPDVKRFADALGGTISRAMAAWPRLRAFGEMVGLLWAQNEVEAALRIEALWNEQRKLHPFLLLCGYPISGPGELASEPLQKICAQHGSVIPAESYTTLTNRDDRVRLIVGLQQKANALQAEILERQQVENELRAVLKKHQDLLTREKIARAEAEMANRLKDEFLATVSHELRTPLNAIIGWAHMLRRGSLDEAMMTRAVETIERNAKSQAQLIEDILDVSRMITGKLHLKVESVDVASVINAAIDSVQLAADAKDIQLEVILDPSTRHVMGDAGRLQQVVWNLLANAINFTGPSGLIQIRMQPLSSSLEIQISDNGQGIGADFLPFIFDRFRQADGSSTRRHGGLGLGLAIVRHLVELHGGTVDVESDGEGCGATFTVRLPLAPNHPGSGRRSTGSLRAVENGNTLPGLLPSLKDLQVLLVDDDLDTLQILCSELTGCKATVQTASSVSEALELLQWYQPDVLVSDLAMPGEDGYSLIDKVRGSQSADSKKISAIALTAYVRVEDRARALAAGFNLFVPKPVQPSELLMAIANLTEPLAKS